MEDGTISEEYFVHNVAKTNEISLLKWAREVKHLSWDSRISRVATEQGNVQMLEFSAEINHCIKTITIGSFTKPRIKVIWIVCDFCSSTSVGFKNKVKRWLLARDRR